MKVSTKIDPSQAKGQSRPADKIVSVAETIAGLDSGPAAELRRGPRVGIGSVAYWWLLAKYEIPLSREEQWADVFQSVAILTPKGRSRDKKKSAHDPKYSMGQALYDTKISEQRLARLLAIPQETRGDPVVRLCRRLSASGCNRFDLRTLTEFILGSKFSSQKIAREYYRANANASVLEQTKT